MTDAARRPTKATTAVKDRAPADPNGALPPEPPWRPPTLQAERRGWFHYVIYGACVVVATMVALLLTDAFERYLDMADDD